MTTLEWFIYITIGLGIIALVFWAYNIIRFIYQLNREE